MIAVPLHCPWLFEKGAGRNVPTTASCCSTSFHKTLLGFVNWQTLSEEQDAKR